jgi:hypothetical protein
MLRRIKIVSFPYIEFIEKNELNLILLHSIGVESLTHHQFHFHEPFELKAIKINHALIKSTRTFFGFSTPAVAQD